MSERTEENNEKPEEKSMTSQENYQNLRRYEFSHADRPDSPELFGVVDELKVARMAENKELQDKIEKGEANRYTPAWDNDGTKLSKKRQRDINQAWKNADKANEKWKESLKTHTS